MKKPFYILIGSILFFCSYPARAGELLAVESKALTTPVQSSTFYKIATFPLMTGPIKKTVLPPVEITSYKKYDHGENSRMAILLTENNETAWLGLAAGLKSIGIPVTITRNWQKALKHRVVLVYPTISGAVLSPAELNAIQNFPDSGGTLIGFNIEGGGLNQTFGIKEAIRSRSRYIMKFSPEFAASNDFTDEREKELLLGTSSHPELGLGTLGYVISDGISVATFEDGLGAIVRKEHGKGQTFAIGLDFGDYILRGMNNRQQFMARSYVNQYEPSIDILLHWLKNCYRKREPLAVTLGTTPLGKMLPIIITHDIDAFQSVQNSLEFSAFENSQKIRTTYFLQTKYVTDWEDAAFLTPEAIGYLKQLAQTGMEIGSHTVSHSRLFSKFPIGTGVERFPDYQPFVKNATECLNCSLLGELRISRFLINSITGSAPESFRPGHLSNPVNLPEALEASEFKFSSTSTANDMLTHLAFRLRRQRGAQKESAVFEFPITIEDEELPTLDKRLPAAIALAGKVAREEGIFVVLIHPNITSYKLQFERDFVKTFIDKAWFGSLSDFGYWWETRDATTLDVLKAGQIIQVNLTSPRLIKGLVLQVPGTWKLLNRKGILKEEPGKIVLGDVKGKFQLLFSDKL